MEKKKKKVIFKALQKNRDSVGVTQYCLQTLLPCELGDLASREGARKHASVNPFTLSLSEIEN